jgi:hypothetical protein
MAEDKNDGRERGWVLISAPDGRRGLWMRVTPEAIEIKAGREGNDWSVRLVLGEVVTDRHVYEARECLEAFVYALGVASDNAVNATGGPSDIFERLAREEAARPAEE